MSLETDVQTQDSNLSLYSKSTDYTREADKLFTLVSMWEAQNSPNIIKMAYRAC